MKLKDKVALVVGGAGAIGRAIAAQLGEAGATVVIADIRGDNVDYPVDITNSAEVKKMVDAVAEKYGAIDILVNSAGGSARAKNAEFERQTVDVIDWILGVNLHGPLYCIHAAVPHMIKRNYGKIINIGSIVGLGGKAGLVDYSAAKGGMIAATKSLAMELGKYNINVNCVSPGLVQRKGENCNMEYLSKTNFLKRICTQDDIAHAVRFLALPESDFVTGQNYVVDGGRSLGLHGD